MDDPVIARADGSVLYNFAVAVDDLDAGITHVDPRRGPPLQHAQAAARARGAGRAAAALRAPAAAARPRRQEALQAPRRRLGAGAARRRLPARGGAQLPRAARLGRRRRRDADLAPTSSSSAFASSACRATRRVRRAEAALDERPLHARAAAPTSSRARLEELTGRTGPARRGRDLARRRSRRWRTSGRWPASSSTARPTTPRRARSGSADGGREALADARAALDGHRAVRRPSTIEPALRGVVEARGAKPQGRLPAGAGRAGRHHGLTGHLRDRSRCSAATSRCARIDARSADLRSCQDATRVGHGPQTPVHTCR